MATDGDLTLPDPSDLEGRSTAALTEEDLSRQLEPLLRGQIRVLTELTQSQAMELEILGAREERDRPGIGGTLLRRSERGVDGRPGDLNGDLTSLAEALERLVAAVDRLAQAS